MGFFISAELSALESAHLPSTFGLVQICPPSGR